MIARFVAWLRGLFAKKAIDPLAGLNRRERRAIAFASSFQVVARLEHRARAAAKRRGGKRPSDNGAKYRRAYEAGYRKGGIGAIAALQKRMEQRVEKLSPTDRAKRALAMVRRAA